VEGGKVGRGGAVPITDAGDVSVVGEGEIDDEECFADSWGESEGIRAVARRGGTSICTGDGDAFSFGHCGGNVWNLMSQ
jgi:hypothetical protein